MSVEVLPAQAALLPPASASSRGNDQHRQTDARSSARPTTIDTSNAAPPHPRGDANHHSQPRSGMDLPPSAPADHANHMAALQAQHAARRTSIVATTAPDSRSARTRTPVSPYYGALAPSPPHPPPGSSADHPFNPADRPPYPGKPPRHAPAGLNGPLGGVQKKKSRFSRSKRRSLGKSKQQHQQQQQQQQAAARTGTADQYMDPGPPALADLRMENRRKTKRHFRGGGGGKNKAARERARAAAMTPGGGLFPITPKVRLGAPTVSNAALMGKNAHMAHLRSCTTPAPGSSALTPGERGILGISSPFSSGPLAAAPYDPAKEAMGPGLDFFGSNEGLIRPVGSPAASASTSDSEMSDSGENEEDAQLPVLRGMELNMGEAESLLRQRQQELRLNDQAGYIVQLEDDNLKLRGKLLTMEEELEKLRRMEDEHLNMQERLYLLEEELAKKNESNAEEELETPRSGGEPEPHAWDT